MDSQYVEADPTLLGRCVAAAVGVQVRGLSLYWPLKISQAALQSSTSLELKQLDTVFSFSSDNANLFQMNFGSFKEQNRNKCSMC